jgi:hypothetical protein
MRIAVYEGIDEPAPRRWIAYIDLGGELMPVRFAAPTRAAVEAKASEFWAAEVEKEKRRRPPPRRKAEPEPDWMQ